MSLEIRNKIIALLEDATDYKYPLRWVDNKTTLGDFDGRNYAIDVFNIPFSNELDLLNKVEAVRNEIKKLIGNKCVFIFHSHEATMKYYSHLFPTLKHINLEKTLKFSSINVSGTDSKPEISDQPIGIYIERAQVAA